MNALAAAFAVILFGGIALLRLRHERMSLEREFEAKTRDAQVLVLTRGNEELEKKYRDLVGSMAEREAELRKRVSELEVEWLKEKRVALEKEFEIKAKDAQILALTSGKDEMGREVLSVNGENDKLERGLEEREMEFNKTGSECEGSRPKEQRDLRNANGELKTDLKAVETDMAYQVGCRDVQVLAPTRVDEELDLQVRRLRSRNEELDCAMAEREASSKEMVLKLEKARAWIGQAEETATLKAKLEELGAENKRLEGRADQDEEKIMELKDKLSECHARLRSSATDPWPPRRIESYNHWPPPQYHQPPPSFPNGPIYSHSAPPVCGGHNRVLVARYVGSSPNEKREEASVAKFVPALEPVKKASKGPWPRIRWNRWPRVLTGVEGKQGG